MQEEAIRRDRKSCSNTEQNALTFPRENLALAKSKIPQI